MDSKRELVIPHGVRSLVRACAAAAIAAFEGVPAHRVAQLRWGSDDSVVPWLLRAASPPATTADVPALVHTVMPEFVVALAPQSAAARIFASGLQLAFDNAGEISVPTLFGDPTLAAFVPEGFPIPVVQGQAELCKLTPHKLACIVVLTSEMVRSSNAEALIADALTRSVALTLDAVLLDDQPASAARPAGLRYGVIGIAADPSTDPRTALISDLTNLYLEVAEVAFRPPIYLQSLARTMKAQLTLDAYEPVTMIGTRALRGTNDMIAVAPDVLVSAFDGVPEISARRENTLQMENAPTDLMTGPTQSTWQTDCVAIRLRLPVSWALRSQAGVAWTIGRW